MSRLSKSLFDLSDKKRQLLDQMLQEEGVETAKAPSQQKITRREHAETIPLSFAQQRLWFIDRMGQAGTAYNMPFVLRFYGSLQAAALERALQEIVERHEALRTTFADVQGEPLQVIQPQMTLALPRFDLRLFSESERARAVQTHITKEVTHAFDLATGPLVRAKLLQLGDAEHVLLLNMHHIVGDGWSVTVLLKELVALYEAFLAEQASPLPELPIQYADYAVWQKAWMQGEVLDKQLSYWKQQLGGAASVLELPTDRPHPPMQTFRGADYRFVLPVELTEAVKLLGQRSEATLFMTLLAAFHVLLYRYTGQEDISVGTPIAGRMRTELEPLIGFFVNTLVMRVDLSGQPSFRALLDRVRQVALGAYGHQDVPFEKLVEELQPQRLLSHSPLFQVLFAVQEPSPEVVGGGIKIQMQEAEAGYAKVDLTLILEETVQGMRGVLTYNTDLYDRSTIERMVSHWQTLLAGIVANPDCPISELPLLTAAEYAQFAAWNETQTDYPQDRCIHQLFEQQVERTPNAVAVAYGHDTLTYAELNRRANQVAHVLQKCGVGVATKVGLSVGRSPDMVVGMLGILKAGGVYVPFDPSYPQERLAFMKEDAELRVLLTQQPLRGGVLDQVEQVICLDADREALAGESTENLPCRATAEQLAYVVYTSGSTGRPKGVCVPHRAVNRLVCQSNYVQLTANDRVAQVSNTSFDAATFEIWGALLSGARLVGITKDIALSPRLFAEELKQQGITAMFLTTALFNQIASTVPDAFSSLHHLLFGGEAVDLRWVREVQAHGAPKRLLHVYGPTESTTFATWQEVGAVPEKATTIPIGHPLANTEIYVLDRQLQRVPVGVPGELHIGGDGLAQGYLNRPEMTAKKFIANPYARRPGARLYKTGDWVRCLADGSIEFLGRLDHQVKVRGFRIELGEIEYVLQQHPAVRETVVVVREEVPGDKRLAAYVVPQPGADLPQHDLLHFAKERLPDYMVPAVILQLAALPLTPNGKVDRQALPDPFGTRPALEQEYVAPRTDIEQKMLAIWQEVLNVRKVGIFDNFFDLGGHSLLVTKVHSKLQDELQTEFSVMQLFKYPTIDSLTHYLTQLLNEERAEQPTYQAAEERARSRQDVINRRKQVSKDRGKIGE